MTAAVFRVHVCYSPCLKIEIVGSCIKTVSASGELDLWIPNLFVTFLTMVGFHSDLVWSEFLSNCPENVLNTIRIWNYIIFNSRLNLTSSPFDICSPPSLFTAKPKLMLSDVMESNEKCWKLGLFNCQACRPIFV